MADLTTLPTAHALCRVFTNLQAHDKMSMSTHAEQPMYQSKIEGITTFFMQIFATYLLASLMTFTAMLILLRNTRTIRRRMTNKTLKKIPVHKSNSKLTLSHTFEALSMETFDFTLRGEW